MKQRYGVLGLDTTKEVVVTFLVLAVVGVSILLALTSLQSGTSAIIDTSILNKLQTNSTTGGINATAFPVINATARNGSNTNFVLVSAFNRNGTGFGFDITNNVSLTSAGLVTNTTSPGFGANATVTYTFDTAYDNGRTSSITANVSNGIVTFFGSTGTIFSIMVVVVIILAISIIIWAVGRFGQQTDSSVTL